MTRVITASEFVVMPWKNGKGETREILKIEDEAGWLLRVSSASVNESGPFSDYNGFDRSLINLGPGNMRLRSEETLIADLGRLDVAHFSGEIPIFCEIDKTCVDFNVFCRAKVMFATTIARKLTKPEFVPIPAGSGLLIYVIDGELIAHDLERREFGVVSGECLVSDIPQVQGAERWMLANAGEGVCAYIAVAFRGGSQREI